MMGRGADGAKWGDIFSWNPRPFDFGLL